MCLQTWLSQSRKLLGLIFPHVKSDYVTKITLTLMVSCQQSSTHPLVEKHNQVFLAAGRQQGNGGVHNWRSLTHQRFTIRIHGKKENSHRLALPSLEKSSPEASRM